MAFDGPSDSWKVTPTVVVFQRVDGRYLLFDILTVPEGEWPYQEAAEFRMVVIRARDVRADQPQS